MNTITLKNITSLHPGSGTGIGVIDMPIQREKHTGYPTIPGSSIKGVIRSIYTGQNEDIIFGPKNDSNSEYASSISISDARILAYPVRSLKNIFALVTCPYVLKRFNEETKRFNEETVEGEKKTVNIPEDGEIICNDKYLVENNSKTVVLEEYDFQKKYEEEITLPDYFEYEKERLCIISDNDFSHFVRYSTEVNARIALEKETKVNKPGALFYEEFVPPEALFYSILILENPRKKDSGIEKETLLEEIKKEFDNKLIQIGGDETIGKGLCKIKIN